MSEFNLEVEVHGDLIVVTQPAAQLIYAKPIATPQLIPMKQTSGDLELLARAWRAANDKARELGWIV
jgi:hypothetical protein